MKIINFINYLFIYNFGWHRANIIMSMFFVFAMFLYHLSSGGAAWYCLDTDVKVFNLIGKPSLKFFFFCNFPSMIAFLTRAEATSTSSYAL